MIPCIVIHSNHNDGAKFASDCAKRLLNTLSYKKVSSYEFYEKNACSSNIHPFLTEKIEEKYGFFSFGHGNEDQILGYKEDPIIDENSSHLLKNKICYSLACSVAKKLGKIIVEKGALCFLGFETKFMYINLCPYKEIFIDTIINGINEMINNNTDINDAYIKMITYYDDKIDEIIKTRNNDRYLLLTVIYLQQNRDGFKILGNGLTSLYG